MENTCVLIYDIRRTQDFEILKLKYETRIIDSTELTDKVIEMIKLATYKIEMAVGFLNIVNIDIKPIFTKIPLNFSRKLENNEHEVIKMTMGINCVWMSEKTVLGSSTKQALAGIDNSAFALIDSPSKKVIWRSQQSA